MSTIYQRITQTILDKLSSGVAPWVRPWRTVADPIPCNMTTNRPYRGINAFMLHLLAEEVGYSSNRWLTYRQAASLGAHVRRGERGVPVIFYQRREPGSEAQDTEYVDGNGARSPIIRVYTVFNVAQIDGLRLDAQDNSHVPDDANERAESLLRQSGAMIRHGGNRAYYRPATDSIQLPQPKAFEDASAYYATALHELVHWTGHAGRCNREFGKRFGDRAYAAEELVAELGSAFLCADCRVDGRLQHAEYIGQWMALLKHDSRAIFVAATKAQQAADYVLGIREATHVAVAA